MDGRGSQRKGSSAEREFAAVLKAHGFDAQRTPRSGGMNFKGDIISFGLREHHFEVKRTERLNLPAAWRQACADASSAQTCVVAHRSNGEPWKVTLLAEDYVGMLEELRELRVNEEVLVTKLAGWEQA